MNDNTHITEKTPGVDVRDMIVVHTALLREFRLAPVAVGRVAIGDHRRAAGVEAHLDLLCGLLHHHHTGEDELLWPVLRPRLTEHAAARIDAAEAQHGAIDAGLTRVRTARTTWADRVDEAGRDALVDALRTVHHLLSEHLDEEERVLLPLASAHLTEKEWSAIGEAGMAAVPTPKLALVFGMFAYEGAPDALAAMIAEAPALPRMLLPHIAPRVYARYARRLYGTSRP